MHSWGDDWPHWNELYEAENYIIAYVSKYSKCRLSSKEKWGTLRYEYVYPPGSRAWWFSLKLPWKKTIKFKDTEYKINRYLFCWPTSWLYYQWMRFGTYTLKKAVKNACIKFPNVAKELTVDLLWL